MENCYFRFDEARPFGSAEHFYHFMWGYLLPASFLALSRKNAPAGSLATRYLFRSCGPLMDALIRELFHDLGYHFLIDSQERLDADHGLTVLKVPRWDLWVDTEWTYQGDTLAVFPNTILPVAGQVFFLRASLLAKLLMPATKPHPDIEPAFLLLKRSQQHDYYRPGGPAEIAGYGTGRRELRGLEQACNFLNDQGLPCAIYEPGRYGLREQVNTFHRCRGVIAMRGAEVANLVWMRPGSQVLVINPANIMHPRPPARVLASLFNLEYREIDVGVDMQPLLEAHRLLDCLSLTAR